MTRDDLRALCDAPGWTTGRVARAIGRAPDTLRGWLRGEPMGTAAADWLARVEWIGVPAGAPRDRVSVLVHAAPGAEPRPAPRRAA